MKKVALKIDVDTYRGTKEGVPQLVSLFKKFDVNATFLFSLGPDNTGRVIKRIFKSGFLKKVTRTSALSVYGLKTLGNGLLWPGPHIGKKCVSEMRSAYDAGHEVGIHAYDHVFWHDYLLKLSYQETKEEFEKAYAMFFNVFGFEAKTAGAAGWQASKSSLRLYDEFALEYGSDVRGDFPFLPKMDEIIFKTPQVPTTLPTLDEMLGRDEFQEEAIAPYLFSQIKKQKFPVFTIHAEFEGMFMRDWFEDFLKKAKDEGVVFCTTREIFIDAVMQENLKVFNVEQGFIDGRAGTLTLQKEE